MTGAYICGIGWEGSVFNGFNVQIVSNNSDFVWSYTVEYLILVYIYVGLRSGADLTSGANFHNGGQFYPTSGANFDSPTTGANFASYTRERQNFAG